MEQKELWPGAGLWLDIPQITADDFAKVERRLNEIGDTLAQISFLKRLEVEFDDLVNQHRRFLRRTENVKEDAEELQNPVLMEFMRRRIGFQVALFIKVEKLTAIRQIEREEERERREMPALAPMATDIGVVEDYLAPPRAGRMIASKELGEVSPLTAAQRVRVFRFLLEAAGMKEDELYKTEIARCIVAATSSEPGKVYERVRQPEQKESKGTYQDLTAVRSWFEKLKMTDMVKKNDKEREHFEG